MCNRILNKQDIRFPKGGSEFARGVDRCEFCQILNDTNVIFCVQFLIFGTPYRTLQFFNFSQFSTCYR